MAKTLLAALAALERDQQVVAAERPMPVRAKPTGYPLIEGSSVPACQGLQSHGCLAFWFVKSMFFVSSAVPPF